MAWDYKTIKTPVFWIDIGGKRLSEFHHKFIEEVTYEDHATGSDICSVTISDPAYEFISDPAFASKTKFKLTGGYRLKHREMLDGYITAVDYSYDADNTPQVIIHAMDKSHEMDRVLKKRSWKDKSKYQVAQAIAKEYGFGFKGKANKYSSKKEETISQSNQSDIELLIGFADECESIVFLKENTLYFIERDYTSSPQETFSYRKGDFSLLTFTPRLVQKDLPEDIDEQDIDDKGKTQKGKGNSRTPTKTPANKGKSLTQVNKDNLQGGKAKANLQQPPKSNLRLVYDGDISLRE